jgi:hypothetical protein
MSRKEDRWDNAPMKSLFPHVETELVMNCDCKTRDQAQASLFCRIQILE